MVKRGFGSWLDWNTNAGLSSSPEATLVLCGVGVEETNEKLISRHLLNQSQSGMCLVVESSTGYRFG
jgi:hypothetical protein